MIKPYYEEPGIVIYHGDCLEVMSLIDDKSIDMILCDLPYGATACQWDTVIPGKPLWTQYKRIIKGGCAIVLTANQPFASALVMSNTRWFKYDWIWNKKSPSDPLNVKRKPMNQHEHILVFGQNTILYNPQLRNDVTVPFGSVGERKTTVYGSSGNIYRSGVGYPLSILEYARPNNLSGGGLHPTQKPVPLFQYLINTYTNEGALILDNCMGSGTTLVAAKALGRKAIGIEISEVYCQTTVDRLRQQVFDFTTPTMPQETQQEINA